MEFTYFEPDLSPLTVMLKMMKKELREWQATVYPIPTVEGIFKWQYGKGASLEWARWTI